MTSCASRAIRQVSTRYRSGNGARGAGRMHSATLGLSAVFACGRWGTTSAGAVRGLRFRRIRHDPRADAGSGDGPGACRPGSQMHRAHEVHADAGRSSAGPAVAVDAAEGARPQGSHPASCPARRTGPCSQWPAGWSGVPDHPAPSTPRRCEGFSDGFQPACPRRRHGHAHCGDGCAQRHGPCRRRPAKTRRSRLRPFLRARRRRLYPAGCVQDLIR